MRSAGIREARQNLSKLIQAVKDGQDVIITDRGIPVARLVGPPRQSDARFRSHADFRAGMPSLDPPLSETLSNDRDERL